MVAQTSCKKEKKAPDCIHEKNAARNIAGYIVS